MNEDGEFVCPRPGTVTSMAELFFAAARKPGSSAELRLASGVIRSLYHRAHRHDERVAELEVKLAALKKQVSESVTTSQHVIAELGDFAYAL